jgi:hypothetical protein
MCPLAFAMTITVCVVWAGNDLCLLLTGKNTDRCFWQKWRKSRRCVHYFPHL